MKKASIKGNTIYNLIKSISSYIFPLIVFPYISRVLQVESIGKINFSNSYVSYFSLLATLGIYPYAVRECAKVKNNKNELEYNASQIYTLNIYTTIIAIAALAVSLVFVKKMHPYVVLIVINAMTIIFTTLGTDWINTAMEDLRYIAVRTLLFQTVYMFCVFLLVKNSSHTYIYAILVSLASIGPNIANIFYRRRYCHIHFLRHIELKKIINPILFLFAMTMSQTIFTNVDTTMLGFIKGDYQVGLYSTAMKVYNIVNVSLASIQYVMMPQMSYNYSIDNYQEINKLLRYALNFLVILGIPACTGMFMMSQEIMVLIGGKSYLGASLALQILSIALIVSLFSGFVCNIILLPYSQEKYCFFAYSIAAGINALLNLIFIPIYGLYAAATTTLVAEFVALIILSRRIEKRIKLSDLKSLFKAPIIGAICIIIISLITKGFITSNILRLIFTILLCFIAYFLVLVFTKDAFFKSFMDSFLLKFRRKN